MFGSNFFGPVLSGDNAPSKGYRGDSERGSTPWDQGHRRRTEGVQNGFLRSLASAVACSDRGLCQNCRRRRIENDTTQGRQRGDLVRGAPAITKAVEAQGSPHLLLLGSDAVQVVDAALDADHRAVQARAATSLTTDFPA
ncbi:hypothetical protein [Caballeronia zhejiangensis]|uniref:hypothetical protein n=1 Tax=Caballeronia zhejiangensis TaxID=871203 RepID=UPI001EF5CF8A|nr:hypothetical protein [Caballeronia zhejiangensis]MCG7400300.1 hypothetical protein [Caballeronia zhejiangensis]